MKVNKLIIIGFISGLLLIGSCEKDNDSHELIGTWNFHKFCNTHMSIGCVYSFNRDFNETITITNDHFTIKYDDSIISASPYHLADSLIVYGQNDFAQYYLLRNDTLTLIDTCFACTIIVYIKK